MNPSYDVIITGAGPAGSMLGYYLALKKINVLLIEKKKLPRYKPCGGGLSKRTLDLLPFDISEVVENICPTVNISVHNRTVFQHTAAHPLISMVLREKFDYFLAGKAVNMGVTLMDNTAFISVTGKAGGLKVQTSRGNYEAKIIVGADGLHGKTAKALALISEKSSMKGIEMEITGYAPDTIGDLTASACFDFGVIPGGYGWVFPKKNQLSVGLVSISKKIDNMKCYLDRYLELKNLEKKTAIRSFQRWRIPYGMPKKAVYANEKGLLVGDAAGLADPITGEGIFYAIKEAELASGIISDSLLHGKEKLHLYNNAMATLRNDLSYAVKLQKLLYKIPRLSHNLLAEQGNILGGYYIDIITGKKTYYQLYKKIFSIKGIKTFLSLFWGSQSLMKGF